MKHVPVPAILNLWSLGHSATDIASKLGTKRRTVSLIVEQARDIGDPRATQHLGKNGRALGRPVSQIDVEVVPAIPAPVCRRGHPRTPENVNKFSHCRECVRIRGKARSARR